MQEFWSITGRAEAHSAWPADVVTHPADLFQQSVTRRGASIGHNSVHDDARESRLYLLQPIYTSQNPSIRHCFCAYFGLIYEYSGAGTARFEP